MPADLKVRYENGIIGKKVDVYRNFHTGGYSVRSRETETYGLVISHEDDVVLTDVEEFVVSESQRQKVIDEGKKNVHAVVRGVVAEDSDWTGADERDSIPVMYNPYEYKHFVHAETEEPIESAEKVRLHEDGVSAVGAVMKN